MTNILSKVYLKKSDLIISLQVCIAFLLIFLLDLQMPTGRGIWILYLLPITILGRIRKLSYFILFILLFIILTVLDFIYGPKGAEIEVVVINRAIGIITMSIVSFIIYQRNKVIYELSEQKNQFHNAIIYNPLPIMVRTEDGEVTMVNQTWKDISGYSKEEIQTVNNWLRLAYGEDAPKMSNLVSNTFHITERTKIGEYKIKTKFGTERTWEFFVAPLGKSPDGKKLIITIANDITEKKDIENKLIQDLKFIKESEQEILRQKIEAEELRDFNSKILESAPFGVAVYEDTGQCTYANESFAVTIGAKKESVLAQNFYSISSWKDSGLFDLAMNTLDNEEVSLKELSFTSTFGKELNVDCRIIPFYSSGRKNILVIFQDISERKRHERSIEFALEELGRSNKDLEQFAYIASHDLQEPIRMIKSYTQLLEVYKNNLSNKKSEEFLGFISEGASRMQQLINDLLQYSRISIKPKPFESVDLNGVLSNVLDDLKIKIAEEKASFIYNNLPVVRGDRTQLRQVFQNLIQNSLKFRSDKNPVIKIESEKQNNSWVISIADNGIGIDKEYFEKIFVIFQRLHGRDRYPGTGIGLALCKKIIEHHGGQICVVSEPDKGTIISFTLPA